MEPRNNTRHTHSRETSPVQSSISQHWRKQLAESAGRSNNNNAYLETVNREYKSSRGKESRFVSYSPSLAMYPVSGSLIHQYKMEDRFRGLRVLLGHSDPQNYVRRRQIEVKKKPVLMNSLVRVKDEPITDELKLGLVRRVNDSLAINKMMQVSHRSIAIWI